MNFLPYTISNYRLAEHKSPNIDGLKKNSQLTSRYKNVDFPTDELENFDKYSLSYLKECFDKQYDSLKKKLDLQFQFQMIEKAEYNRSLRQYEEIFFVNFHDDPANASPNDLSFVGFFKKDIIEYKQIQIQKEEAKKEMAHLQNLEKSAKENSSFVGQMTNELEKSNENTKIEQLLGTNKNKITNKKYELPDEEDTDYEEEDEPRVKNPPRLATEIAPDTIGISVSALRQITGYSYNVKLAWHNTPREVTWQKEMMEDNSNFLVVDGSRQGGKSFAISQKIFEESFIVGEDIMVAAFQQDTTEVIWDYLIDLIEKMPEGDFTIKERKRYIQNNFTGTRIHFRTLQNGAKGIRGKTLRLIVVDEAMLISDDIFESILLPTQTTVENPKMILLGTASPDTSCFMYKLIRDIKRGEKYNNKDQYTARHIRFSILENPFASPKVVRYALDRRNDPRVQREYFNKWGKIDEALFQYEQISIFETTPNTDYNIIISYDPARKQDRSGYAVLLAGNNQILVLESGEIPSHYKATWSLQGKYLNKLRAKYHNFPHLTTAGDETGVGDGAFESIELSAGFTIDKRVHYVAGNSEGENKEKTIFHTGKSFLINNLLDLISEKQIKIVKELNKDLIEEGESLEETKNSLGHISFKTDFFDDITNALLIGAYIVKKFQLHRKSAVRIVKPNDAFKEEMRRYNTKGFQKFKASRVA